MDCEADKDTNLIRVLPETFAVLPNKNTTVMRKLILGLAVTLDGYIEGPNGEYDWCFTDQDYGLNEFFKRIDASFIGRKSYEIAQQHALNTNGETIPGMPEIKEYVFSRTLKTVKEFYLDIFYNVYGATNLFSIPKLNHG